MAISNINTIISNDIQKVWNIVLAVDKYNSWRSDLSKTEIINDKQFIEYTKNGYATTFTVTVVEPYKRWEFDMDNSNMKGHWIGIFTDKGNETQIDFTENVIPKKWFATVYKGNIIKNLIMDCQSYTKYRPNETTGGIFVSWRRKEKLPTGA
ncbi:SRPBCC family protein [Blautia wexlerae]|uniref:SRPBCC family protein n=2 Tax=Blautia wexlerae TaxID=418240 RepID=UPI00248143D5|nr:SRPBCC family protein [Blautia wexlerae]MDB2174365.1 SRPBCC family protein [Blautia wexlerae]